MVAETAQHAGHADIVREMIDGRGGPDHDSADDATWQQYLDTVQAAADAFASPARLDPGEDSWGSAGRWVCSNEGAGRGSLS